MRVAVTEFRILGSLEVREDERLLELGGGKQRAVLAVLLLSRGETVSTDRLIDALWGESPPPRAAKTLQAYVSRLRRAVDPERLVRDRHGYRLVIEPGELDLDRFERLVGQGREFLARGEAQQAEEALGLHTRKCH